MDDQTSPGCGQRVRDCSERLFYWRYKSSADANLAAFQLSGIPSPLAIKKAEEQFKNIQVLKGVPADQLFPTMQFISASLGVECDFCHVQGAFEKDDKKPKQIARKMMEMMFAINKDNFDGHRAVTCYSCHRGNAKPAAIPVVMAEETNRTPLNMPSSAGEAKDSKQPTGPSGDQLLEKYVQASGGAAAIDKVSTRVMKGTMDFGGKSVADRHLCERSFQSDFICSSARRR